MNWRTPRELKGDGGKPRAGGRVVEACAHQRHRRHDSEAVCEAPAEQGGIARGHQDTGSGDVFRGSDERLHVEIALRCCVTEKCQCAGVTGDAAGALDDKGGGLLNGLLQLHVAIEAMHLI